MALSPYPVHDDLIGTGRAEDRGRRDNPFAWRVSPNWDRWFNQAHQILSALDSSVGGIPALIGRVTSLEGQMVTVQGQITAILATIAGYAVAFVTGTLTAVSGTITTLTVTAATATTLTLSGLFNLTGGQIKFPAVQVPSTDANTLDDYEEGSFTPTVQFGGAAVGVTYTRQEGYYIKIGRQVFVTARVTLSNKGSSVGNMTMLGFPFSHDGGTAAAAVAVAAYGSAFATLTSMPVFFMSNTTIFPAHWGAAGVAALTNANFTNTTDFLTSFSYRATA
jgi:hypothetical protein